jgi:hypothetical protein
MPFPIATLLLGLAVLLLCVLLIVAPFFERKRAAVNPPSKLESLEIERKRIVRLIRELDFDHRTRKISDDDYKHLRAELAQRGTDTLREIDAHIQSAATRNVDDEIELAVAKLRATASQLEQKQS